MHVVATEELDPPAGALLAVDPESIDTRRTLDMPERAEYFRVILAELSRISSHLLWVGTHALDMGRAVAAVPGAPRIDRLRHYFNHPGFIEPMVDATLSALADLPEDARRGGHLVFVTHSIPLSMNEASGPRGGAYVAQHRVVAAEIVERVREETGHRYASDLVFCSRSGPPHVPWLEPDVNDHLRALDARKVPGAVVVPIGFVSDHMEVIYDLDTEARATAEELGLPFARAATAGVDPRFVAMVRDLLLERSAVERGERVERATRGSDDVWDVCAPGCCANPRGARPALCGQD